jgi:hypothetical protein
MTSRGPYLGGRKGVDVDRLNGSLVCTAGITEMSGKSKAANDHLLISAPGAPRRYF